MLALFSGDEQLVRRALKGKREAFETLVHRHLPSVRAIAYARTGNFADAEDVSQETFLRALQGLGTLREAGRFGAWLAGIARHVALQLVKVRVRESATLHEGVTAVTLPEMERRELRATVRKRLEELDETSREVILLHYFAGRNAREVAELLDISQEAARKRLQRAREALGALLLRDIQDNEEASRQFTGGSSGILHGLAAIPYPWHAATTSAGVGAATGGFGLAGAIMKANTVVALCATVSLIVAGALIAVATRPWREGADSGQPVSAPAAVGGGRARAGTDNQPVAATPAKLASRGTSLSGFVCNSQNQPISGATVRLADYDKPKPFVWHTTTTDDTGAFRFEQLAPSNRIMIRPEKDGMIRADTMSKGVLIIDGNMYTLPKSGLSNVTITLWQSGTVRGYVTDAQGRFLPNEDVTAKLISYQMPIVEPETFAFLKSLISSKSNDSLAPTVSTKTNAQGRFELTGLLPGTHILVAAPEQQMRDLKDGEVVLREGETLDGIRLVVLLNALSISGRVLDERGRPIAGAFVQGLGEQSSCYATTAEDGTYRLSRLSEGALSLHAHHDDFDHAFRAGIVAGSQGVDLIMTGKAAGISGRIIEAGTGKPVNDFEIQVIEGKAGILPPSHYEKFQACHDEQGRFTVSSVPSGLATVVVRASGFAMAFQRVETTSEHTTDGVTVLLFAGTAVDGLVLTSKGEPVADAFIIAGNLLGQLPESPKKEEILEQLGIARSDTRGRFRVDCLNPGRQVLSAYCAGSAKGSVSFTLAEQPLRDIVITVSQGGTVTGRVLLAGQPVEGANLTAVSPGGIGVPSAESVTDADGAYTLTGATPGQAAIVAEVLLPGTRMMRRQSRAVLVSEAKSCEASFDFMPGMASIEGQVTVRGEATRGHIRLRLDCGDEATEERFTQVAEDGHYRIENLPAGSGTVEAGVFSSGKGGMRKVVDIETDGISGVSQDISLTGQAAVRGHVQGIGANEHGTVIALEGEVELPQYSVEAIWAIAPRSSAAASVDDDGSYRVEGLEPGIYTLVATAVPSRGIEGMNMSRTTACVVEVVDGADITADLFVP